MQIRIVGLCLLASVSVPFSSKADGNSPTSSPRPIESIPETWASEQKCDEGWFWGSVNWMRDGFANRLADLQDGIWTGRWRWTPRDYDKISHLEPNAAELKYFETVYGIEKVQNLSSLVRHRLIETGLTTPLELRYLQSKNKGKELDSAQWGNLAWLKTLVRLRSMRMISGFAESLRILPENRIPSKAVIQTAYPEVTAETPQQKSRLVEAFFNHMAFQSDVVLRTMVADLKSEFLTRERMGPSAQRELDDLSRLATQNHLRDTVERLVSLEEEVYAWDHIRGRKKKEVQAFMHYIFQDHEPELLGLLTKEVNRWKRLRDLWSAFPQPEKFLEKVGQHSEYARYASRELRFLVNRNPDEFKDGFLDSALAHFISKLPPWETLVQSENPEFELNSARVGIVKELRDQIEVAKATTPVLFVSLPSWNPLSSSTLAGYLRANAKMRRSRNLSLEFQDLITLAVEKNMAEVQANALAQLLNDYDDLLELPCRHHVLGPMIYEYETELNQYVRANNYLTHYSHLNLLPKYHKALTRDLADWKAVEALSAPLLVGLGYKALAWGGVVSGNLLRVSRIFPNMIGSRMINVSQVFNSAASRVLAIRSLNAASGTIFTTKVISDLPQAKNDMDRAEAEAYTQLALAEESLWSMRYYAEMFKANRSESVSLEAAVRETQEFLLQHSLGKQAGYGRAWWGFYGRVAMALWMGSLTIRDTQFILRNVRPVADPTGQAVLALTDPSHRVLRLLSALEINARTVIRGFRGKTVPVTLEETGLFGAMTRIYRAQNLFVKSRDGLANTAGNLPGMQKAMESVRRASQIFSSKLPPGVSQRILRDSVPKAKNIALSPQNLQGLKDGAVIEVNTIRSGQIMTIKAPDGRVLIENGRFSPGISVEAGTNGAYVFRETSTREVLYTLSDTTYIPVVVSRGLYQRPISLLPNQAGLAADDLVMQIHPKFRASYLRRLKHRHYFYSGEAGETATQAAFRYYLNSPFHIVKDIGHGTLQGAYMVVASTILTVGGLAALHQAVFSGWILAQLEHLSPITMERWPFFRLLYNRLLWLQVDQNQRSVMDREVGVHLQYVYIAQEVVWAREQEDSYRNTSALYDSISILMKRLLANPSDPKSQSELAHKLEQGIAQNQKAIQDLRLHMVAVFDEQIATLQTTLKSLDTALTDYARQLSDTQINDERKVQLRADRDSTREERVRTQAALDENVKMRSVFEKGWETHSQKVTQSLNDILTLVRGLPQASAPLRSNEEFHSLLAELDGVRERRDVMLDRFRKVMKLRMDAWAHELYVQIESHDLAVEAIERYWRGELGDTDALIEIKKEDGQVQSLRFRLFGYEGTYSRVLEDQKSNLQDLFPTASPFHSESWKMERK